MSEQAGLEWKWRMECPKFSGEQEDYKRWKGQVEDWLKVCGDNIKFPGLQIRLSLKGRALDIAEGIDREELMEEGGEKIVLKKLDGAYQKDALIDYYSKMKRYFRIERESGEKMRDFIIRYEKLEWECNKAMGKNMFGEEAKGFHVLETANLSDNQKQMVLAACGKEKLEYSTVAQIMKRIFEGLGNKEESEWLGSEGYSNVQREREEITETEEEGTEAGV